MRIHLALIAFPMALVWMGCLDRPLAPNPPPDNGPDSQNVANHEVKDSAVIAIGSMDDLDYQKSLLMDSTTMGPPHRIEYYRIQNPAMTLRIQREWPVTALGSTDCAPGTFLEDNLLPGPGQKLFLIKSICSRLSRLDTSLMTPIDHYWLFHGNSGSGSCGENFPMSEFQECLVVQEGKKFLRIVTDVNTGKRIKIGKMAKLEQSDFPPDPVDSQFISGPIRDTLDYEMSLTFGISPAGFFPDNPYYPFLAFRDAIIFFPNTIIAQDTGQLMGCNFNVCSEHFVAAAQNQELFLANQSCETISAWTPEHWVKTDRFKIFLSTPTWNTGHWHGGLDRSNQCLMLRDGWQRIKLAPYLTTVNGEETPKLYFEAMARRVP